MPAFSKKTGLLAALLSALWLCGLSPPNCDPQSRGKAGLFTPPPCHTRASIQKIIQESHGLVKGVKETVYTGGVLVYPDPTNWASRARITKEPCQFEVKAENGRHIIKASIFPHPIVIMAPTDPNSDFYIAVSAANDDDVFILQQIRGGKASLAYSGYTSTGRLNYGACGNPDEDDLDRPSCLVD